MPGFEGLEGTFDTVVNKYEKMRPGYSPELYQMIFGYVDIGENSRAVEVGSGSGQATLPLLAKGCEVVSVEYGENFSKLLADKFKDYKFSVITGKFEDVELPSDSFDLVFSATAFHWVPEEIGYKKVFDILRSGGAFARFANNPFTAKNDPKLAAKIDSYYEEYYNRFHNRKSAPKIEFNEERAIERTNIAAKYGFTDIKYALFHRERVFTATEYLELLGTYSDHIAIEEKLRNEFFGKIEAAINESGGTITISDTMDLELARKT